MSFSEKLKNFFGFKSALSEEVFEELSDLLVEGDFGAAGAFKTVEKLQDMCKKEKITDGEGARKALARLLAQMLQKAGEAETDPGELGVILLLGVNGVGKTTTAAKLAGLYRQRGRRPLLAAGDTFRAAAVEQLKIHGERLGLRVVAHRQGGDPAAVIYDAVEAARSGSGDLIIADTAGRMHTKSALVEELKKIDRIVESRAEKAVYFKWLVLDATTGRNALAQAETFHEAVSLNGVILTKYDSSARGGVIFSLAEELSLPLVYICDGEKYGDIRPFDRTLYAEEFAGA